MTEIEELQKEVGDLKKENHALSAENLKLEIEVEKLEEEVEDLEEANKKLELQHDALPLVNLLERFADHFNWTSSTWTPLLKGIDEHPADMAHRALKENL